MTTELIPGIITLRDKKTFAPIVDIAVLFNKEDYVNLFQETGRIFIVSRDQQRFLNIDVNDYCVEFQVEGGMQQFMSDAYDVE